MNKESSSAPVFAVEYAGLGDVLSAQTPYDQASKICGELIDSASRAGDLRTAGRAARAQAECLRRSGRVTEAMAGFTTALGLFRAFDDKSEYSWTLWFRSNLRRQVGDFAGSLLDLNRAAVASYDSKDSTLLAYLVAGRAEDTRIRGDYRSAERQHLRAVKFFKELGDVRGLVWAIQGIAQIRKNHGEWREARGLFQTSSDLARGAHDNRALGWGLRGLGEIFLGASDFERAAPLLQFSLRSFEQAKCVVGAGFANLTIGKLMAKKGAEEGAADSLAHANKLFVEAGDKRGLAYVASALGQIHGRKGNRDYAIACNKLALRWFWDKGVRFGATQASAALASWGLRPDAEIAGYIEGADVIEEALQAYCSR